MVHEVADLTGRLTEALTRVNGLMDALGLRASSDPPSHESGAAALHSARAGSDALARLAATQADMLRESVQDLSGTTDSPAGEPDTPASEPGPYLSSPPP